MGLYMQQQKSRRAPLLLLQQQHTHTHIFITCTYARRHKRTAERKLDAKKSHAKVVKPPSSTVYSHARDVGDAVAEP